MYAKPRLDNESPLRVTKEKSYPIVSSMKKKKKSLLEKKKQTS